MNLTSALSGVLLIACSRRGPEENPQPSPVTPTEPALAIPATPTPAPTPSHEAPPTPVPNTSSLSELLDLVDNSACAARSWADRGKAPRAYVRGVALVYARAVCDPQRADLAVVTAPVSDDVKRDVLAWYAVGEGDRLRQVYTLLLGLGMRESSGRHCCGRDMSADFNTADTAEAGLFQASWGARAASPELSALYERYKADRTGCLLDTFSEGISCRAGDAVNWGEGEGRDFQELSKACPAFATEYAAVLIRTSGGKRGEFGPLRRKEAEAPPECDALLAQIAGAVQKDPGLCDLL